MQIVYTTYESLMNKIIHVRLNLLKPLKSVNDNDRYWMEFFLVKYQYSKPFNFTQTNEL